jgi:alanyl-tRNA synthetase
MGFERACSIIQNTKGFTDFSRKPSNYNTDVFRTIFAKIEELSGKTYSDIYPDLGADRTKFDEEMKTAIAFRVIADHLRTLSFSIADGILPGNNGRNYVLRRILRRAVKYGRQLGFSGDKPLFDGLVSTLVEQMGSVFPELKNREQAIRETLNREEESFNLTLDRGLKRFEDGSATLAAGATFPGDLAFELYDTFGFPIDLTQLLCTERGLGLDMARFEELMEQQQERSRAAQKSTIVRALDIATEAVTEFVGFEADEVEAIVLEVHPQDDALFVITDKTPFYAEMGGQAGDTGTLTVAAVSNRQASSHPISAVQQIGRARAVAIPLDADVRVGDQVTLKLDSSRRRPIEAHHTATHLLHWALHEVVSKDAAQQGSSVDENRLRFDFNSGAVTGEQLVAIEELVNAKIAENGVVSWTEVPHASIKGRPDIMQFFGDKYGDTVRVVQIGGEANALNGYSMELCGGTHVRQTGAIGLFKIKSEGAIAAGVRRIEAACGENAWVYLKEFFEKWALDLKAARERSAIVNAKLVSLCVAPTWVDDLPPNFIAEMLAQRPDISKINEALAYCQRMLEQTQQAIIEGEKQIKKIQSAQSAQQADAELAELIEAGKPIVKTFEADASLVQELLNGLKKKNFGNAAFFIVDDGEKLQLATYCGDAAQAAGHKAGDLLRELAAIAGGKGGGKADQARGGAPDRTKVAELEAAAKAKLL